MVAKTEHKYGDRYGKLTVLHEVPVSDRRTEHGTRREFILRCDCGIVIQKPLKDVLSGKHVSCGCHGIEARRASTTTHGMSDSKPYKSWAHMKERCTKPNADYYEMYGGRGISYDPRWESFSEFWLDMGSTYQDGLEIDRIDPDGNYVKSNCRWATESLQGFNQRKRVTNTSGRTGVYASATGSWWAEIQEAGKTVHLGTFPSFEDACNARSVAELRIYGFTKT